MILFLIASGLNIIFGMMGILNMAHTAFFMLAAYFCYAVVGLTGNFWLGLALAPAFTALLGVVMERLFLRRVAGHMSELILTMGISFVIVAAIKKIWGTESLPLQMPEILQGMVNIVGVSYPVYRLFVIGLALVILVFMMLLLYRTRLGKIVRAAVSDRDMVNALGININKIFTGTFVVASAFAGLGGALNAPLIMVGPYMGFDMLLLAFITVIVGGLGSIKGTALSAILIGQVISVGGTIWGPLAYVAPFIAMFIVILVKPTGLMGVKSAAY
jgi:branched-chain amino acid transport system permease protein